jgi:hypothetical protein
LSTDFADEELAFVGIAGTGARLSDLSIFGPRPGISVVNAAQDVSIEGVSVQGARGAGIFALEGTSVGITRVSVSATEKNIRDLAMGIYLFGANAELSHVALTKNLGYGLAAEGTEAAAVAEDLVVTGSGVAVFGGANATLARLVVARNTDAALLARGAGSRLVAHDAFIAGGGWGVFVDQSAALELQRVTMGGLTHRSVHASDAGTTLQFRDVVVRNTAPVQGLLSQGIALEEGATLTASRLALMENADVGLGALDSVLDLEDVVVGRMKTSTAPEFVPVGMETHSSELSLARALFFDIDGNSLVTEGQTATLEDIRVAGGTAPEGAYAYGVVVSDEEATLNRVAVDRNATVGTAGVVVIASADTHLSVTDLRATGNDVGVFAHSESTHPLDIAIGRAFLDANERTGVSMLGAAIDLHLSDARIHNTRSPRSGQVSTGVAISKMPDEAAEGERHATLERVSFDDTYGDAIVALYRGTELTLRDVQIANTNPVEGVGGTALSLDGGAVARGKRIAVKASSQAALSVVGSDSDLQLEDVLVENTRTTEQGFGFGLVVIDGTARVDRSVFDANVQSAIALSPDELCDECGKTPLQGKLTLRDSIVRNTASSSSDGSLGNGLLVVAGTASLERVAFVENRTAGVFAFDGAEVTLRDVEVQDTLPPAMGDRPGVSLGVAREARIDAERIRLTRSRGAGVAGLLGGRLDLRDLIVTNTESEPHGLRGGRALEVQGGATATVNRALICGSRDYAFVALDSGTALDLRKTRVLQTRPADCADSSCMDAPGGGGIVVHGGSSAELADFDISTSALVGIMIVDAKSFRAREGRVVRNRIGINVQDADLDLTQAFENVIVEDNENDYDLSQLPVPEASDVESLLEDFDRHANDQ